MTETTKDLRDNLTAEFEIRSLVQRYADASSRRDPAAVAGTFTEDGEWHSPAMGKYQGREAVASFFATMLEDWNVFLQGLMSGVVVLHATNPDRATGRWFVQEVGQRSEGSDLSVAGVYHDEYLRDAGNWRIVRRQYDPLLISADGAATALPFPTDVPGID